MNMNETLIDVRPMVPRDRHPTIFNTWQSLGQGGSILLVNDHDPIPLYYQFVCEHGGGFHWEYLDQGPELWRVRIRKGDFSNPGFVPRNKPAPAPAVPVDFNEPLVLDTRPIFERGETPCQAIDQSVAALQPGQDFIMLVPFEPIPLYSKLTNLGFSRQSTQLEDGTWRIEFKKTGEATGAYVPCGGH
jgi:uncharacterized protein (DUF2249 family)